MRDAAALWQITISDIETDLRTRHRQSRGTLLQQPGIVAILNSGIPFACYVYGTEPDVPAVLPALLASDPVPMVHLADGSPGREALEAAGWVHDQRVTQMVLPLSRRGTFAPPTPDTRLEELAIPQGIAPFYDAMAQGFGEDLADAEQELPREVILTQGIRLFVARDEHGQIVGTAGARRRGRGATLFAISVVPAWRGRGIGSALTSLATESMFESGAASVQLHATQAGHHVYERASFTACGSWVFFKPAALTAAR